MMCGRSLASAAGVESAGVTRQESRFSLRERNAFSFRGAKGDNQFCAPMHVRHQWPPRMEPPPHGQWVLMQPWNRQPAQGLAADARRVDEVWAYSRYVRQCYLDAGVPSNRVHVVPLEGRKPGRS